MNSTPPDPATRKAVAALIDDWLGRQEAENPVVEAVNAERKGSDPSGVDRWYVRLRGEEKDVSALWFTLRQRTLHLESYVMPAPEENMAEFYRHLLVRNLGFYGFAFAVGAEDAIFLEGQIDIHHVTEPELDRLLGSAFTYIEQCFWPALRIGFATRLAAAEDV